MTRAVRAQTARPSRRRTTTPRSQRGKSYKCREKGQKIKGPHLNCPTRKQLAIFHLPNNKSQPPKSKDPDQQPRHANVQTEHPLLPSIQPDDIYRMGDQQLRQNLVREPVYPTSQRRSRATGTEARCVLVSARSQNGAGREGITGYVRPGQDSGRVQGYFLPRPRVRFVHSAT